MPSAALPQADPELEAGTTVGEYKILSVIGKGGFGRVYRARHAVIGRMAAIKVLSRQHSSNPQAVSRFITEARAVNQIKHPNIVDIFSFGVLPDERRYLVMELLEGVTLEELLYREGILLPAMAVAILRGIASALDAAHAVGIIHRDIKPENIFVELDNRKVTRAKLLDFGIAKLGGDEGQGQTKTGTVLGTPLYMSPEQARGRMLDARSDIYSLGVVAFEALTGRPPFDTLDPVELAMAQTTADPPRPSRVYSALPPAVDAPLLAALSREPSLRPASAREAVAQIEAALFPGGPPLAEPEIDLAAPRNNRPRSSRRHALEQHSTLAAPAEIPPPISSLRDPPATGRTNPDNARTTEAPRPASGQPLLLILGLGACLLGGSILLGVGKNTPPPSSSASAPASSAAPSPPETSATAPPASAAIPAPASPEPAEIEVSVQGAPPGAIVRADGKLLGEAPGPFKLRRGDATVSLSISADGYKTSSASVVPTSNVVLSVPLVRATGAPGAVIKTPKELDNPFQK